MKKAQFLSVFLYLAVTGIYVTAIFFQSTYRMESKNEKNFIAPPTGLKNFTLGYNDFQSSILWLRLVQDFHYCENGKFTASDFTKPLELKDKTDAILLRKQKPSKCHLGWVYQMLDYISEIQPKMKITYDIGATLLSVSIDDREGARRLFEKGLAEYPKDWQLNYRAGYHFLWETQNAKRAAEVFDVAQKNGAPAWVASLSANLYSKSGQLHVARSVLLDALARKPNKLSEDRIRLRLKQVDEALALIPKK